MAVVVLLASGCGTGQPAAQLTVEGQAAFGAVAVGDRAERTIVLTSTGDALVTVTGLRLGGDATGAFSVAPRTAFELPPDSPRVVTVGFAPAAAGDHAAELVIGTGTGDRRVPLSGRGFVPELTVEPDTLDFGEVVVGQPLEHTVMATNAGEGPSQVAVALLGDPAFTLGHPPPGEALVLEAGAVGAVRVSFAPTTAPHGAQGLLSLRACGACDPVEVPLRGTALDHALAVGPEALDFGEVNPGAAVAREVTFANRGRTSVRVSGLRVEDPNGGAPPAAYELAEAGPVDLAPGGEARVAVRFAPGSLEPMLGRLAWNSNDPRRSAGYVTLAGSGGGPDVRVEPEGLAFGAVATGTWAERRVRVSNAGWAPLRVEVAVDGATAFVLPQAPDAPVLVEPGTAWELPVRFAPDAEGLHEAVLRLATDDADTPVLSLPLAGEAVALPPCAYELRPASLTFGLVEPGRTLRRSFALVNTGTADCLVGDVRLEDASPSLTLVAPASGATPLPPGGRHEVTVELRAPAQGVVLGTVALYVSDAAGHRATVDLDGEVGAVPWFVAPPEVDFGETLPGCETRRDVRLYARTTTQKLLSARLEVPGFGPCTPDDGCPFALGTVPAGLLTGGGVDLPTTGAAAFDLRHRPQPGAPGRGALILGFEGVPRPLVIPLGGRVAEEARRLERFVQFPLEPVDVLFVVDDSGSMGDDQVLLGSNFDAFLEPAVQRGLAWQVGVTTTDMTTVDGNVPGLLAPQDAASAAERIVHPGLPDPLATFQERVRVGDDGDATERGLAGAAAALSPPLITDPALNGGFRRPGARLALVFVSDEPDQSFERTIDYYADFFRAQVGFQPGRVTATALPMYYQSLPRYAEVAEALGGGAWLDGWARLWADAPRTALTHAGRRSFGDLDRVTLAEVPEAGTVTVHVTQGGTLREVAGWTWDAAENAVVFDEAARPAPGETIEVGYRVPACAP